MNWERLLRQTCVYWAPIRNDGRGGTIFAPGVEVKCHWEEKQDLYTNKNGEDALSQAAVDVASDMKIGGWLFLGALDDLTNSACEADPTQEPYAFPIEKFNKIPALAGNDYGREAVL